MTREYNSEYNNGFQHSENSAFEWYVPRQKTAIATEKPSNTTIPLEGVRMDIAKDSSSVTKWTYEERLGQKACKEVSSDQGSTTDFGSTTSPSDADCEDKGFYKNDSNESLSSFTTNSSNDVSASNSSADLPHGIFHTPPPPIEDVPSKRQCLGLKRRGIETGKDCTDEERQNPCGGTRVVAGVSFL